MLHNYLLLAFKILQRHKFYTCVSLFGISLTLMVLIIVTSVVESFTHPRGPEINSDRFLVAGYTVMMQKGPNGGISRTTGALNYHFVEEYVLPMKTPALISVFSGSLAGPLGSKEMVGFRNGVKIKSYVKRTDANYWKILQFDFLEGRPINAQEHEQGSYVAVISESTRSRYFSDESAVGKTIDLDGMHFQVIGVVRDVSLLQTFAASDIWLPIFATPSTQFRTDSSRDFSVLFLANSQADLARIKDEYHVVVRNYTPPRPVWFTAGPLEFYSHAISKLGLYTTFLTGVDASYEDAETTHINKVMSMLSAAALVFMLLPVINLVNINLSRILERASEIGVRKSFGASSGHLVRQFIVENLVITVIGGALGFVLAKLVLMLLVGSGLLAGEAFYFNYRIFGLGLLYILVFGLLSAVYPAWKMSRLDPVRALKGAI